MITQKAMSQLSGVDKATMSRYLSGSKIPVLTTAHHIATTCKVPMNIFLEVEVQEKFLGKSYLKQNAEYKKRESK